jgi:YgiT-type zinc finger domain-containing protein
MEDEHMEADYCVICGGTLEFRRAIREISIRGHRVPVDVEGDWCTACGEVLLTPTQAREARQRAMEALRRT